MEMTGDRLIPAPRDAVWRALNDPEVLKAAIPGCTSLVKDDDTRMTATATVKVGPISAKFAGKVQLLDLDPPNGYRIAGEGQGGIAGFATGGATLRLSEREGGTLLEYAAEVQIGGKIAQLGARLIDSTAKQMTNVFFDRFVAAIVSSEPAAAPAVEVEAVAGSGTAPAPVATDGDGATPAPVATPTAAAKETPPPAPTAHPALPPAAYAVPGVGGSWHGGSLLLGVVTGSVITIIAIVIGHYL